MILNDDRQEDTIYVIEHYGKQGMKWGVRSASPNASKADKAKIERRRKNIKKTAVILGVGAAAATAAIVAGKVFANSRMSVPMKEVRTGTSAEHKKFISDFTKKQFRLNAAANGDLKKLYDMNETPIHMRDYLPILPGQTFGR